MTPRKKKKNEDFGVSSQDIIGSFISTAEDNEEIKTLAPSQIKTNPKQPRRYFDPEKLENLVCSIREHGILEPLIVRHLKSEHYELIAGERRLRAALQLELESVPVVIRNFSDEQVIEIAIMENLQREDLNPVEETEGILKLLCIKTTLDVEAVIALLNQAAHPNRSSVDNVIHSPEWIKLKETFAVIGKLTPESFRTNRLPLLKLPKEILEALRQGTIEYTKARAIAKVKSNSLRQELLQETIKQKLSLSTIRERIKAINADKKSDASATLVNDFKENLNRAIKSKALSDPNKRRQFEKMLSDFMKNLNKLTDEE